MGSIALPARAKLNLDLVVEGRRSDGLHELRTHMQAVALHDLLIVQKAKLRTEMSLSGLVPVGSGPNSVLKALSALELVVGHSLPTRFWLNKRIPSGSGMGGASSDAATALRAVVALYELDVDIPELAKQIGSDVSFFLKGGGALVEGAGERVTPQPVADTWFAIAWPGIELSTALAYRAYDEVGGEGPNQLRRAASRVNPSLDKFAMALGEGWRMTGSGSAFFLECPDQASAAAAAERVDCWTAVTQSVGPWA